MTGEAENTQDKTTEETPPKKRRGRPAGSNIIVSEEVKEKVCAYAQLGLSLGDLAFLVGIKKSSLNSSLRREATFKARFKAAQKTGKASSLKKIYDSKDWRAHAWLLERTFPDEYALQSKLEHSTKGGKPMVANIRIPDNSTPSQIEAMLKGFGFANKE